MHKNELSKKGKLVSRTTVPGDAKPSKHFSKSNSSLNGSGARSDWTGSERQFAVSSVQLQDSQTLCPIKVESHGASGSRSWNRFTVSRQLLIEFLVICMLKSLFPQFLVFSVMSLNACVLHKSEQSAWNGTAGENAECLFKTKYCTMGSSRSGNGKWGHATRAIWFKST